MNSVVIECFEKLKETIKEEYCETQTLSDDTLSMLSFLCGSDLAASALDLVEKRCVNRISSPSGRQIFKVGNTHICTQNSNYCSCPSFIFQVLKKGQYMCKHKLAAELSSCMGMCNDVDYTDETVALMLKGE